MRTLALVAISFLALSGCGDAQPPLGVAASLTVDRAAPDKHECGDDGDGDRDKPKKCKKGLTCCGGACVNLATDAGNCGACGKACVAPSGGSAVCSAGACTIGCAAGERICPGGAAGVCTANPAGNFGGATFAPPPSLVAGDIAAVGTTQTYSFVAPAAPPPGMTRISVTETPTSALLAIVTLYDGGGNVVSSSCGGVNSVSVVFAPGSQYFVVVGGVGTSTGSYTLATALAP